MRGAVAAGAAAVVGLVLGACSTGSPSAAPTPTVEQEIEPLRCHAPSAEAAAARAGGPTELASLLFPDATVSAGPETGGRTVVIVDAGGRAVSLTMYRRHGSWHVDSQCD